MRAEIIRRAKSGLLDDDELQFVITEQIEEDPSFWTGSGKTRTVINVEVNDGHVTLKGVVRSAVERRRADILARALGAAGVENVLRVLDDSSPGQAQGNRIRYDKTGLAASGPPDPPAPFSRLRLAVRTSVTPSSATEAR